MVHVDVEVERKGDESGVAWPIEDGQVDVEVRTDSEFGVAVESAPWNMETIKCP